MITGPAVWLDPCSQKVKLMGVVSDGPTSKIVSKCSKKGYRSSKVFHIFISGIFEIVDKVESMPQ